MSDFQCLVTEFWHDLKIAFPELEASGSLLSVIEGKNSEEELSEVMDFSKKVLIPRFFEILYKSDSLFENDDLCVLPGVNISELWRKNISDGTRSAIWSYLQLMTFALSNDVRDQTEFGEAAQMFEAVDGEVLREQLQKAIDEMKSTFDGAPGEDAVPDPQALHDHFEGLMKGKLGSLAKEIAAEAAETLGLDQETDPKECVARLMKSPAKLMALLKKMGEKLEDKIQSGEIRESELYEEASDLVAGVRSAPGMGPMEEFLKRFGGTAKASGVESELKRRAAAAKQRERMKDELARRTKAKVERESNAKETDDTAARAAADECARLLIEEESALTKQIEVKPVSKKKKKKKGAK